MTEVHSGRGLGIYGIHDVVKALERGIADLVLVTDDIMYSKLDIRCKACKNIETIIVDRSQVIATRQEWLSRPCPACSATDLEVTDKDIVDYLNELAIKTGCRLEVISGKTEEGAQLASLGKIGAVLRYKPT
jgi:peptide chain release factor subunit 1